MRTKNVWWGNQGILGVGNRHDNSWRRASGAQELVVATSMQWEKVFLGYQLVFLAVPFFRWGNRRYTLPRPGAPPRRRRTPARAWFCSVTKKFKKAYVYNFFEFYYFKYFTTICNHSWRCKMRNTTLVFPLSLLLRRRLKFV